MAVGLPACHTAGIHEFLALHWQNLFPKFFPISSEQPYFVDNASKTATLR
jgi:hypothetical protein